MSECKVEGCDHEHLARGWCAMHYQRWSKHGDLLTSERNRSPNLIDRLDRFEINGDCWEWNGSRNSGNYGHLTHRHRRWRAHVASWVVHNGPVPDGAQVLHTCDNPPCINPDHLRSGTVVENMRDMVARDRSLKGVKNTNHKVTEADVLAIRLDPRLHRVIAADYGISRTAVSNIQTRRRWGWLESGEGDMQ